MTEMANSWLLITGARVIDGRGNPPVNDTPVLVHGDTIAAVGHGASLEDIPRGDDVSVIDASGKVLMPGLIDAHCHLTYGESKTQEDQDLYTSVESRTLAAAHNVVKMLDAGVTSFCEPGGSYYIGVAIRDAIESGMLVGPRMTSAGRYLTTSNGIADFYPTAVGTPDGSVGLLTNSASEMVAAVRVHVKNGVDLIKLADSPYGEFQAFTYDELAAIVEVAHQLHRKVTIHARGSGEVSAAIRAGVDWIMHGNLMNDEVIALLAESGIPLCPTLLLHANWSQYGHLYGVPASIREGTKRMMEVSADTLHKAHDAGVEFMMGTDTGFAATPYGEWHARELELLMDVAGLSALEAIRAGTESSALSVNGEGLIGVVAPGMKADLLVVNGDPSRDITVLQDRERLVHVISRGTPHRRSDISSWRLDEEQLLSAGYLTRDLVASDRASSDNVPGADPPATHHENQISRGKRVASQRS